MNITPFLRTPFTDLFSTLHHYQNHRECAPHELRTVDCVEAYGLPRGIEKCQKLLDDFRECVVKSKQLARVDIMAVERRRQYMAGERKERYAEDIEINSY